MRLKVNTTKCSIALGLLSTLAAWQAPAVGQGQALPAGMVPAVPRGNEGTGDWPSKAALLDAARAGSFNGIPHLRLNLLPGAEKEMAPFFLSVKTILHLEYGVPAFPEWPGQCRSEFVNQVTALFQDVVQANLSVLSDRPPEFTNTQASDQSGAIRDRLKNLQRPGSYCDRQVLGQWRAHPYKAAVPQLLTEFGKAQAEWVIAEHRRRKDSYAAEQQRQQTEASERQTRQREAEQKRIETERARIEADQKRRQQDKPRISG